MDIETLRQKWQEAIRHKYPKAVLRIDTNPDNEEGHLPSFTVFMVPDDQGREFITEFFMEERRAMMQRYNLPDADFGSVGVSSTRTYYPEIYREARAESAAKSVTKAPRKSRTHRTTSSRNSSSTPAVSKNK